MKMKILALLLTFAMLFSAMPGSVIAADAADDSDVTITETPGGTNVTDPEIPSTDIPDTDPPGAPKTPETPEEPKAPETPKDPEVPGTPEEPETPGASEEPKAPEAPKEPEIVDVEALLAHLLACKSEQELWTLMQTFTDEDWAAIETHIGNAEEAAALRAFADGECPPPPVIPKTVNFTEAGAPLPAVTVGGIGKSAARRALAPQGEATGNGLELIKNVAVENGSYTLTLEAYTTGTVTEVNKVLPMDIVLVLDQSGSMALDFNGNSTSTDTARRQYAMKLAVNNFITSVADKYGTEADHRIAIVTFNNNKNRLCGWTAVSSAGKTTLQGAINGLPNSPSGTTNVAAGMTEAQTLMGSGYNYTGANQTRQKVVIMFTDGVPTTDSDFNTTVATNAIAAAKALKDAGVTIYSIGIFAGADPSQLYGATGFNTNSNGTVGSYWEARRGIFSGGDLDTAEIPAGNRFLNYLSSNYKTASEIGLTRSTRSEWLGAITYLRFTISKNFSSTGSGYYLTADNANSLNDIFTNISDYIGTPTTPLGSDAVIKDVMSNYFTLPEGATADDIKTYTAAKTASNWAARQDFNATVTVVGNVVSVSGFDYDTNYVTTQPRDGNFYGKKLIIEFTIVPRDGFWGGNNVQTNGAGSGVYKNTAQTEPVENFIVPEANVPLTLPTLIAKDKNIYAGNTAPTAEELVELEDIPTGWETDYVNVTYAPHTAILNTEDGEYTVTATIKPTFNGNNAEGTPVTLAGYPVDATAKVTVFKPHVTFQDSVINLGETADYEDNFVETAPIVWKNGAGKVADPEEMGDAPTLTFEYDPEKGEFEKDADVTVTKVTGESNGFVYFPKVPPEAPELIAFGWNKNESVCTDTEAPENAHFRVHVLVPSFDLTITKNVTGGAPSQSFIFDIKDSNNQIFMTVAIHPEDFTNGTASVTINDLPNGSYTVTERGGWSWKYQLNGSNGQSVTNQNGTAGATFENKRNTVNWLGDSEVKKNIGRGAA